MTTTKFLRYSMVVVMVAAITTYLVSVFYLAITKFQSVSREAETTLVGVLDTEWKSCVGKQVKGDYVNYAIEKWGSDVFFKVVTQKNPTGFSEFSSRTDKNSLGYISNTSVFRCDGITVDGSVVGVLFVESGSSTLQSESLEYLRSVEQQLQSKIEGVQLLDGTPEISTTGDAYERSLEYAQLYQQLVVLQLENQVLEERSE